jgi:hypothetical protein
MHRTPQKPPAVALPVLSKEWTESNSRGGGRRGFRAAFTAFCYENATPARIAVIYLLIVAVALTISLPIIGTVKADAKQADEDRTALLLETLTNYVDRQIALMRAAHGLFVGFVASGAPLQIPDYATMTKEERVNVTLTTGTPGAMSIESYFRLRSRLERRFFGFWDVLVQPAGVSVFRDTGFDRDGIDYLTERTSEVDAEYEYMIDTAQPTIRGPRNQTERGDRDGRRYMSYRTPIYDIPIAQLPQTNSTPIPQGNATTTSAPDLGPYWKHFWGSITIRWDLDDFVATSDMKSLIPPDMYVLFESIPWIEDRYEPTRYYLLFTNVAPEDFVGDSVTACCTTDGYENLCFRARPAGGWAGEDRGVAIATACILCIVIPLFAVGVVASVTRLIIGPEPSPLRYAPVRAPFHAVCVDMLNSTKMLAEAPFMMPEVMTIYNLEIDRLAEVHRLYIAVRQGTTVVLVTSHRRSIIEFCDDFTNWAITVSWPSMAKMHWPSRSILFNTVLHTCATATFTVGAGEYCDIHGFDIQLLLAMRNAGVPGHVVCTGQFLGLDPLDPARPWLAPNIDPAALAVLAAQNGLRIGHFTETHGSCDEVRGRGVTHHFARTDPDRVVVRASAAHHQPRSSAAGANDVDHDVSLSMSQQRIQPEHATHNNAASDPRTVSVGGVHAFSRTVSTSRESVDASAIRSFVREIGMCEVPVPKNDMSGKRVMMPVVGFLLPSAATRRVSLHHAIDHFPEQVWQDWKLNRAQVSRLSAGSENGGFPEFNPLEYAHAEESVRKDSISGRDPSSGEGTGSFQQHGQQRTQQPSSENNRVARSTAPAGATTVKVGTRPREVGAFAHLASTTTCVQPVHRANGIAQFGLPSTAVDLPALRQLATMLGPALLRRRAGKHSGATNSGSGTGSSSLTHGTVGHHGVPPIDMASRIEAANALSPQVPQQVPSQESRHLHSTSTTSHAHPHFEDPDAAAPAAGPTGRSATTTVASSSTKTEDIDAFRRLLSLGSYYLLAYRVAFAPLDFNEHREMLDRLCHSLSLPHDSYHVWLAARCARLSQPLVDEIAPLQSSSVAA